MRKKKKGLPMGVLIALVSVALVLSVLLLVVKYLEDHGKLGNAAVDEGSAANGEITAENPGIDFPTTVIDESAEAGSAGLSFPDFDSGLMLDENSFSKVKPLHKDEDISSLQYEVNPDIYAWLYVPDTGMDCPVLRRLDEYDQLYYTGHNEKGEEDANGAAFTQIYNLDEFKDYVTIIYGSNNEGGVFSDLKMYRDPAFFSSHPYMYVYTEDKLLIYRVFAAYEASDVHIIMYYAPTIDWLYERYLEKLEELPGEDANVNKQAWPGKDDRILTLSTHIEGKEDKRYLVQSTLYGIKELKPGSVTDGE
jgi:sortase B